MIIPGSNPPSTLHYPQSMYTVNLSEMIVEEVTVIRNCGWHSDIHVTQGGKPIAGELLFKTQIEAVNFARNLLDSEIEDLSKKKENLARSIKSLGVTRE